MHATMAGVAKAAEAGGKDTAGVIAAIVATRKLNAAICHAMGDATGDCPQDEVLYRVNASKTKYKDFEGQIAAVIPAEIDIDKAGKTMTVLERAQS